MGIKKIVCLFVMIFAAGSLYPQQKSEYPTGTWHDELACLKEDLVAHKGQVSPESMEKVCRYLSDKPVQILQEQEVWQVVGLFIMSDPYSRGFEYVCSNMNRYPRADHADMIGRMNITMAKAISEDPSPEKIVLLKENLRKYILPKSAFYLARLEIDRCIGEKKFAEALDIADHADRLGIFHKEDRYLLDVYRAVVGGTAGDAGAARKVLAAVMRMQFESGSRIEANVYDIIADCYRSMGENELADENMKTYQEKSERYQKVNREFLEMIKRAAGIK